MTSPYVLGCRWMVKRLMWRLAVSGRVGHGLDFTSYYRIARQNFTASQGEMRVLKKIRTVLLVGLALAVLVPGARLAAQEEASRGLIEVGEMAPDFTMTGATRHGVLKEKVRLSDYRGDTVVLAFFFRVRTRG